MTPRNVRIAVVAFLVTFVVLHLGGDTWTASAIGASAAMLVPE